jgi:hypothetical protein
LGFKPPLAELRQKSDLFTDSESSRRELGGEGLNPEIYRGILRTLCQTPFSSMLLDAQLPVDKSAEAHR